jgi:hypothetical protein
MAYEKFFAVCEQLSEKIGALGVTGASSKVSDGVGKEKNK